MKSVILLIMVSLCAGCIHVDLEPDTAAPRLAVIGLISPTDSIMTVFVSRVYNLGEEISLDSGLVVKNATVKIGNEANSVHLTFNDSTWKYEYTQKGFIVYGKTYNLTIQVPGEPLVKATCKVMDQINGIRLDTSSDSKDFHLKLNWKDSPLEENYYSLNGYYRLPQDTITTYGIYWNADQYYSIDINAPDISEGSNITVEGIIENKRIFTGTTMYVSLLNLDKDTYEFFDKRTKQYYQQQSLQKSILDFVFHASANGGKLSDVFERFKDPVRLPNTIENGTGVFGSYALQHWMIRPKQ